MTAGGLWRPAAWLAAAGAIVAAAVLGTAAVTRDRIARNESAQVLKLLREVLPADGWDNAPDLDRVLVRDPDLLGSSEPVPVYRARLGTVPVAAVLTVTARDGYGGPIVLLVGIDADGRVHAVRVLSHRETPGIGDFIEGRRSPWMHGFAGRSLAVPPPAAWTVRRDGGAFDEVTGATVTSRAVVRAVRDAVACFGQHREEIFAPAAEESP